MGGGAEGFRYQGVEALARMLNYEPNEHLLDAIQFLEGLQVERNAVLRKRKKPPPPAGARRSPKGEDVDEWPLL